MDNKSNRKSNKYAECQLARFPNRWFFHFSRWHSFCWIIFSLSQRRTISFHNKSRILIGIQTQAEDVEGGDELSSNGCRMEKRDRRHRRPSLSYFNRPFSSSPLPTEKSRNEERESKKERKREGQREKNILSTCNAGVWSISNKWNTSICIQKNWAVGEDGSRKLEQSWHCLSHRVKYPVEERGRKKNSFHFDLLLFFFLYHDSGCCRKPVENIFIIVFFFLFFFFVVVVLLE